MEPLGWDHKSNQFIPIDEKNITKRDEDFVQDDPTKDRIANLIDYMRNHPAYNDPNPWPYSMLLFCFKQEEDGLKYVRSGITSMNSFMEMTDEGLMEYYQDGDLVAFTPVIDKCHNAEQAQTILDNFHAQSVEKRHKYFKYLLTNRWFVARPIDLPKKCHHEFCDDCSGCRPAIIDLSTKKAFANETPVMQAVNKYWDEETSYAQRKAYIEVTVNNSTDDRDMAHAQVVMKKISDILKELMI